MYRSSRFEAGEMQGLEQVWQAIDLLEGSAQLEVRTEILSGASYRRQLSPDAQARFGDVNYVIQAVLQIPQRTDGKRVRVHGYLDGAMDTLCALELPGERQLDLGGLHGLDPATSKLAMGSTGTTEKDILFIYPPWVQSKWEEASRTCLAFVGILPPQPRGLMEEHPVSWDEKSMRQGHIVFEQTPSGLQTY